MKSYSGSCLCGKIHYEVSEPFLKFQLCHCSRCRKITGSAHASNIMVPPEQFRWTQGEDQLGRFELEEAHHFATEFCKICGSTLPWLTQSGEAMVIPAGTLDTPLEIKPERNVFWGHKASWHCHTDQLDSFDTVPDKSKPQH